MQHRKVLIFSGFMPPTPVTTVLSNPTSPAAGNSRWDSFSSIFSSTTSSPPANSTWHQDNVFQISLPPSTSTALNSTLLSSNPGMSETWSDNRSPPARSTHAIWSVSNAVTMDEDRNTAEVNKCELYPVTYPHISPMSTNSLQKFRYLYQQYCLSKLICLLICQMSSG